MFNSSLLEKIEMEGRDGCRRELFPYFLRINEIAYTKKRLGYSGETKSLFEDLGVKPYVVELDELGGTERHVQNALQGLTGQSTVPNVFIGGKHIGGCSDTMELHQNGELIPLLSAAGVKVV